MNKQNFKLVFDSKIIRPELKEEFEQLCEFNNLRECQLIYRASKDGFEFDDFHRHCDDKSGTVLVIKTKEGHIHGGFTFATWNCLNNKKIEDGFKTDLDAFVFSLRNWSQTPIKIKVANGKENRAVASGTTIYTGRAFGFGQFDLVICEEKNCLSRGEIYFGEVFSQFNSSNCSHYNSIFKTFRRFEIQEIEMFLNSHNKLKTEKKSSKQEAS